MEVEEFCDGRMPWWLVKKPFDLRGTNPLIFVYWLFFYSKYDSISILHSFTSLINFNDFRYEKAKNIAPSKNGKNKNCFQYKTVVIIPNIKITIPAFKIYRANFVVVFKILLL